MNTPIQRLREVMVKDLRRLQENEEKGSKVIKEYIELIDEVWLDVEREYIKKGCTKGSKNTDSNTY